MIDLPPGELIQRLQDGKVYVPEEATRALGHFFSTANLSALRELALRRAAQAVDRQMLDHVATTGQAGNWAAGERILVAFSGEPSSEQLVRSAKRLADAFHASWSVVTVEMPGMAQARAGKVQPSSALNLAVSLGASIVTVPATSVPAGLSGYAREVRATAIVLGQSPHSWLLRAVRGTLLDQLSRALPGVALHVLPNADPVRRSRPAPGAINWTVAIGLALVALTTLANLFIADTIGKDPVDLIYLIPVIATATRYGLRPALIASMSAALAFNFFFLEPKYTLTIDSPGNLVTFVALAGVGVVASQLAGRLRRAATVG